MTFTIHQSPKDQQFYVRVASANGEPWFTSEGYPTLANARRSCRDFFDAVRAEAELVLVVE